MVQPSIDAVMEAYSPGCHFEPIVAVGENDFNGFWYTNYRSGEDQRPAPPLVALQQIATIMVEQGSALSTEDALNAFLAIMSTTAFSKIVAVAEHRAAIPLYGMLAIAAIKLHLEARTTNTGRVAIASWQRFVLFAKRYRDLTEITVEDITEFNTTVTTLGLPIWLQLTQ